MHNGNESHGELRPTNGLTRKDSTPLAPPFMVSAPGKVIVTGEHAVVYGKAAIAAAVSLRSYLLVTTLSKTRRTVSLRFPDIGFSHTWNIDGLPWSTFRHPKHKKTYYDLVTSLSPECLEALKPHVTVISPDVPAAERKTHQASATAFLYLFLSLGSPDSPPAIYTLRSTIPLGAGLGSSASVSVCLSAALLTQAHALSGPHPDQPGEESAIQIERINRWAFVGELCIHGNPSGVDNTVSTQGKAVLFRRSDYNKPPTVTRLSTFPVLPLLLVDTKQPRSTAVEVAKVGKLRKERPDIAEPILEAIDRITEEAHQIITEPQQNGNANDHHDGRDQLTRLGELIAMNHGLLVALGVSHPRLERLKALVDTSEVGWTKLTGAGGGGCAITLLKSFASGSTSGNASPNTNGNGTALPAGSYKISLHNLEQQLSEEGFEKFETILGGEGVGVLWPAILHNSSDEEGGQEIDMEKFLTAKGRDGVEKLVGVRSNASVKPEGVRRGWKFWTI